MTAPKPVRRRWTRAGNCPAPPQPQDKRGVASFLCYPMFAATNGCGNFEDAVGFSCFDLRATQEFLMAQIGDPVRRYTVIPLQEPVSPTPERVTPPPPPKHPVPAQPITQPEAEPVR